MAITKKAGRQAPITAKVSFTMGTGADVSAVAVYEAIEVPEGAIVTGGYLYISDATTATVDLNIGDGGSSTRYASAVDGAATGLTALVPTGYQYTAKDTIDIAITVAAAEAAGAGELVVTYIVDGREVFTQG